MMENRPQDKQKQPWPMRYIVMAIIAFILIFQIYLLLNA